MDWSGNFVLFDNSDKKGENIFHCLCCDESDDSLQTMQMLVKKSTVTCCSSIIPVDSNRSPRTTDWQIGFASNQDGARRLQLRSENSVAYAYELKDRIMMWLLQVYGAQCEVSDVEVDNKI
nr:BV-like protein [Cotesia vestalis bracovirus]